MAYNIKLNVDVREAYLVWFRITNHLNKLTEKEVNYLVELFTEGFAANKLDEEILDNSRIRAAVKHTLGVAKDSKIIYGLTKKGAIKDGLLNMNFVPKLKNGVLNVNYTLNVHGM